MMPQMDGYEVCSRVRGFSLAPIIMLTAKGEQVDKLRGFEAGADDYLTKPFAPLELMARVQSVLGFGGILISGALFAIILFSKTHIPRETAERFKTLAPNVKQAVLPFVGEGL